MLNIIEKIVCLFKGHDIRFAGTCPYTRRSYNACLRCGKTSVQGIVFDLTEEVDKEDL
jgi:hypothetical protein